MSGKLAKVLWNTASVSTDSLIWLLTLFAGSAQSLFSSLSEIQLVNKMLHFLHETHRRSRRSLAWTTEILFTIVHDSFPFPSALNSIMHFARYLDILNIGLPYQPDCQANVAESRQALPSEGPQLVTRTCSCGEQLSDYYCESQPGAVDELQRRLRSEHAKAKTRRLSVSSLILSFFGRQGRLLQKTADTAIVGAKNMRAASGTVGPGASMTSSTSVLVASTTSAPPTRDIPLNSYLLLCFPEKFAGLKLHQEQIIRSTGQPSSNHPIACDRDLFKQLRRTYVAARKTRFPWFWPRTVTRVSLAYFLVDYEKYVELRHYGCQANHSDCRSIPPTDNTDYDYLPRDPPYRPPIATNYLTHYFQNPDCIQSDTLTVTLNQIPKRLSECLTNSGSTRVEGWGLEFEEGWHQGRLQKMAILLITIGAAIFLALWWGLEKDVQGASGVASFCVGSLATLGYLASADHRMLS